LAEGARRESASRRIECVVYGSTFGGIPTLFGRIRWHVSNSSISTK
jgi:hypothetical protein